MVAAAPPQVPQVRQPPLLRRLTARLLHPQAPTAARPLPVAVVALLAPVIEPGQLKVAAFRKWLLAGLLVLVPFIVTLWVLEWVVSTLDQTLNILPEAWQPERYFGVRIPGLGVILALAIVLSIGALASNIVGNRLISWWHALLHRIPVVRSIYSGVKQVSDTVLSEKGNAFRKALLVQWPHEGMWTIAFLTGSPQGEVLEQLRTRPGSSSDDAFHSVFVPTTPNPTGGYFVLVRQRDCVALQMSVEAALTYIVSMGVIVPGGPKNPTLQSAAAAAATPR